MSDNQNVQQPNNSDDEFEYIELDDDGNEVQDDAQEYEYEYVEVPEDENEMTVASQSHELNTEENNDSLKTGLNAALDATNSDNNPKKEAPFPSFLRGPNWQEEQQPIAPATTTNTEISSLPPQTENLSAEKVDQPMSQPEVPQPEDILPIEEMADASVDDLVKTNTNAEDVDLADISQQISAQEEKHSVSHASEQTAPTLSENSAETLELLPQTDDISLDDLLGADNLDINQLENEVAPDPEVASVPETKLISEPKAAPAPQLMPEPEPKPEPDPTPQLTPEPEPKSEPAPQLISEPQSMAPEVNISQTLQPEAEATTLPSYLHSTDVEPQAEVAPQVAATEMPRSDIVPQQEKSEQQVEYTTKFKIEDFSLSDFDKLVELEKLQFVQKFEGVQSFKANTHVKDLALSDIDFANKEILNWSLILFSNKIVPIVAGEQEVCKQTENKAQQFVSLYKGHEKKFDLFNEKDLKIINTSDAFVAADGRFVCGDFGNDANLTVAEFTTYALKDYVGKKLCFFEPASGILCGAGGTMIFFSGVQNLWVPNSTIAAQDEQKLKYKISKWYSGSLHDKYFEFDALSESAEFVGNDEVKAIHLNVENNTLGWNVQFDNGVTLGLHDLREYQMKYGKLPSANGVVQFGQKRLKFQNVERIVIYKTTQYFFYS